MQTAVTRMRALLSTGIVGGMLQPIALSLGSIETSIPSLPTCHRAGPGRSEGQEGSEDGQAAANACARQGFVLAGRRVSCTRCDPIVYLISLAQSQYAGIMAGVVGNVHILQGVTTYNSRLLTGGPRC